MKRHHFDFIIVGSGIAGLSAAKELCSKGRVAVLTKGDIKSGSTQWAQGGIAAAMTPDDTPKFHLEDTLYAGDGLCDEAMVKILVEEGPSRVQDLISLGAEFDKSGSSFDYTQEGAHSKRRILHAGDATGREIERSLGQHLLREKNIHFFYPYNDYLIICERRCLLWV